MRNWKALAAPILAGAIGAWMAGGPARAQVQIMGGGGAVLTLGPGNVTHNGGYLLVQTGPIYLGSFAGEIGLNTAQTPDTMLIGVPATGNSLVIAEEADVGFDFAHAQQTDPCLFIQSHNQVTNQYGTLCHDGTNFNLSGTGLINLSGNTQIASSGGAAYLGSSGSGGQGWYWATQETPDAPQMFTNTLSNYWVFIESGDTGIDHAHPLATNPWFFFQSKNTTGTEYNAIGAVGLRSELFKTLTESSATAVVQIPVASGASVSGHFRYAVYAADATDQELRSSMIRYTVANKAGTETCALAPMTTSTPDASITELEDLNLPVLTAGTLTYAIACDTSPANAVNITINAVSSLTQTTLQARYQLEHQGPSEPLPQ